MRSFGQFAIKQFDFPIADNAVEFLFRRSGQRRWSGTASHAFVHGGVGEGIGLLIFPAENMADGKPIQLSDQFFGTRMQVL